MMNHSPRSLSARLARLEAAIGVQEPRCEGCGFPATEIICVVVMKDDSPLPECEVCGRTLDPRTGRPIRGPFRCLIGVDSDRM